jgi:hypothetical protein
LRNVRNVCISLHQQRCCSILEVLAQHETPGEADVHHLKIDLAVGTSMAGRGMASTALPIAS